MARPRHAAPVARRDAVQLGRAEDAFNVTRTWLDAKGFGYDDLLAGRLDEALLELELRWHVTWFHRFQHDMFTGVNNDSLLTNNNTWLNRHGKESAATCQEVRLDNVTLASYVVFYVTPGHSR